MGLIEEDGKLYLNVKFVVPGSRVLQLCKARHHHMVHPGAKKQALDMQRWFEHDIGLYNAIKQVKTACLVCQEYHPYNWNIQGEAHWAPIPDQPMRSMAMDVFFMPKGRIGKEFFNCVVLCVDRPSGYIVAVPMRKNGLLAKKVAVMMGRH